MSFNHARNISQIVLAIAWLLQLAPTARAESTPSFTLVQPEITLDPGLADGRGSLLLTAEKLDGTNIGKPLGNVEGLDTGFTPGPLKFDVKDLDKTETSRRWLLTTEIKGLPNNAVQKRYLSFQFDNKTVTLPFTLTNKNSATFVWSVKAPAESTLPSGEPLEISIAVQGVAATKVTLLQSTLLEQSRKRPVDGGWILCDKRTDTPAGCRSQELNLPAHSAQQLWLYPGKGSTLIGKYMGNVTISATEKPEGETLAVTVYGTNLCRQFLGVLVILVGIFFAWILTVYLQNRLNRDQLLLPAVMLRDRFELLRRTLENRPAAAMAFTCPQTFAELDKSEAALSEKSLVANGQLSPSIPNPFKPLTPNSDSYKQLITDQTARFELLQLVVNSGLQAIWKQIPQQVDAAKQTAINTAFAKADAISSQTPPPAANDVVVSLQAILTDLNTALASGGTANLLAASFKPRTSDQIVAEIRTFSGLAWLVFALFATALGTYVMILSNLGFGTISDYLICLFWGFGLPIGGAQLAQSTTGSAATALGFSIPKPS